MILKKLLAKFVNGQLEKKDIKDLKKLAKNEIKEWELFIKFLDDYEKLP